MPSATFVSSGSSLAESEAQTRHNNTIGGKMDRIDFFVAGGIAKTSLRLKA
jgi:hypothetical protein